MKAGGVADAEEQRVLSLEQLMSKTNLYAEDTWSQ